jgi:hypothetical protein
MFSDVKGGSLRSNYGRFTPILSDQAFCKKPSKIKQGMGGDGFSGEPLEGLTTGNM